MKKYLFTSSMVGLALFAGLVLFSGCDKKAKYESPAVFAADFAGTSKMATKSARATAYGDMANDESFAANQTIEAEAATLERKLIKTGSINFEVKSLADASDQIEAWVRSFGGYISNSYESYNSISITANIPAARFEEAMNASSELGKLQSRSVNSRDVTEQYYDLDTRLNTRKILIERLESYLKEAKNVQDMIDIEARINDVTSEIESMQGQFNRLSKQIDYSEINVYAQLPPNTTEQGFVFPDTKSEFRNFLSNVLEFFSGFLFIILYIVIFGVPIVLLLFLLFWLCFGKVGLLRRLFNKTKAEKK